MSRPTRALVIGEALIDEVVVGDGAVRHPGGSPANVAVGLARLGVPTDFHTALGRDSDGAVVAEHLAAAGVYLTPGSWTDEPTSVATARIGADGSAEYVFRVSWAPAGPPSTGPAELVHTGSIAAFLSPGAEVVRATLTRAREVGAVTTFDPNIRPALLPDAPESRRTFAALVAQSDIVKLSDEDAEFLFPGTPLAAVLDELVSSGARVAAVTRGADGALLASGRHRIAVDPVPTRVADTVGAGDTFMAALIWALCFDGIAPSSGTQLAETITEDRLAAVGRAAAHAAAITVSRAGADLPTRDEVLASLPQS
jgi:fructokinase